MAYQHLLDDGKIEKLVAKLRALAPDNPELAVAVRTEANYFERNAARMRYPELRRQGLFVGSGVIEAGRKTVIASRLKRSGMLWTVRGANAVIAVRCCRHSRKFNDYWDSRGGGNALSLSCTHLLVYRFTKTYPNEIVSCYAGAWQESPGSPNWPSVPSSCRSCSS